MIKRQNGQSPPLWQRSALALALAVMASGAAQATVLKADFNGDGFEDLVVGVPSNDTSGRRNAGSVDVFYGAGNGLPRANPQQVFSQDTPGEGDSPGIAGGAEAQDNFGSTLAVGDFNDDGFTDLAVGVPFEDVAGVGADGIGVDAGVINIIYGSNSGLLTRGNHLLTLPPVLNQPGDVFGRTLASGDLNGDGFSDLIVGAPGWDHATAGENAGAVMVFFGGDAGLSDGRGIFLNQNLSFILGESNASDRFGAALTVADFNRDGLDDVAIGIPGEDIGDFIDAGMVVMLFGSSAGGISIDNIAFVDPELGAEDRFGIPLTAGDFNGDGNPDLAVGNRLDDFGSENAGAVTVFYGTGTRPRFVARVQLWHNLPDNEEGDRFGSSLTAADFDGNGADDLAIGTPSEDQERFLLGSKLSTGRVTVLYGITGRGLTITSRSDWHQDKDGVANERDESDSFGTALSFGDFNHDGIADLVVGVPGEDVDTGRNQEGAGIVHVFYGTLEGLSSDPAFGLEVLSEGIGTVGPAASREGDRFGSALP